MAPAPIQWLPPVRAGVCPILAGRLQTRGLDSPLVGMLRGLRLLFLLSSTIDASMHN